MTGKKREKIREQVWKMCKSFPSRQLTYTRHATRHSGKWTKNVHTTATKIIRR